MITLIEQLKKAVDIGKKLGLNENLVVIFFTMETLVTELMLAFISKVGEEKFFEFLKEVSVSTGIPLSDSEVVGYKARFKHLQGIMKGEVR